MNKKPTTIKPKRMFFSTSNQGKLNEVKNIASEYGIEIVSPIDLGIDIKVVEDGVTFQENAIKKVEAFRKHIDDNDLYIVGDDSGVEIAALDDKPGVYTRRWAGYEMTDQEIRDYCLNQMKNFDGDDRRAVIKTTLALFKVGEPMQFFTGELNGVILSKPVDKTPIPGLAFNTIFYIPEIDMDLVDLHGKTLQGRNGYMTHRERALHKLFNYINLK